MENLPNKLLSVCKTLENVEVRGKTNMTNLLACIKFLEELAQDISSEENVYKDESES